jgi:hypothetical protein
VFVTFFLKINPFQNLFYPGFKFFLSGGAIWNSFLEFFQTYQCRIIDMIEYNKFIKRMLQTQVLKSFPPIKKTIYMYIQNKNKACMHGEDLYKMA